MMELRPEDAIHKSYLNRLLIEIVDNPRLSQALAFTGGTCAAMLGYLDRFSVGLDFDVVAEANESGIRKELKTIFDGLGLTVKKEFDQVLMFQVQYPNSGGKRNTVKLSVNTLKVAANQYKVQYFPEIDRLINSQTIETMFANKLVAVLDRYKNHGTIAGRDIYDIHHFFVEGYVYSDGVIRERTGEDPKVYIKILSDFIKKNVNQNIINEDLNTLLPDKQFQGIRKVLIPETMSFLERFYSKEG